MSFFFLLGWIDIDKGLMIWGGILVCKIWFVLIKFWIVFLIKLVCERDDLLFLKIVGFGKLMNGNKYFLFIMLRIKLGVLICF